MKRTNLTGVVDVVAFLGFVVLTTTGVLMRYILPPGSGHASTILGLDRHEWGDLHFWVSVVFLSVLALHLILHWRWILNAVTGRSHEKLGFRAGLGIVGLLAVVALAISLLLIPVERGLSGKEISPPSSHNENLLIRGSMTFKEIEETTGVPAKYIIEKLELPESISTGAQLGPLKRKYGFEISDVREIIRDFKSRKKSRKMKNSHTFKESTKHA